jgi:hypothetical protein
VTEKSEGNKGETIFKREKEGKIIMNHERTKGS